MQLLTIARHFSTHAFALGVGFILGIYLLPILIEPDAPDTKAITAVAAQSTYSAVFSRDRIDSDQFALGRRHRQHFRARDRICRRNWRRDRIINSTSHRCLWKRRKTSNRTKPLWYVSQMLKPLAASLLIFRGRSIFTNTIRSLSGARPFHSTSARASTVNCARQTALCTQTPPLTAMRSAFLHSKAIMAIARL